MPKFYLSAGLLVSLAFSLLCYGQEVNQEETAQKKEQSTSPTSAPTMPREVTFESSVGNVVFPHSKHLKLGCNTCHHQIHADELNTPHPDYLTSSWINCQICHDGNAETKGRYYKCSNCHETDPADIVNETLSSKVVIHKSCWKCHKSGTGVKASKGCGDCHVKEGS
jgi:hypothetical protein